MIDHPNLSMDALDLVDPTAPVSEGILLSSSIDEIELEDPATGDPIGEVAESNEADALATIKRARAQAEDGRWSQMSPDERQSLIDRLVGVMESRAEALAEIGTLESGTPVSYSSGIHVQAPLDVLRRVTASTTDPGLDIAVIGSHQPMYAAMQTVADSLGRGRASVVVPTAIAPLSTIALMNCLLEADLPKGVVSAVLGTPDVLTVIRSCAAEVAADTLRDSSPGSPGAGSTPLMQMPGSDVTDALRTALLAYQCTPGWRPGSAHLLVPTDELDEYAAATSDVVDSLEVGDPWHESTSIGPIPGGTEATSAYLNNLESSGATVTAGTNGENNQLFIAATVASGLDDVSLALNASICAPVVCVIGYSDAATAEEWMASRYAPVTD